MTKNTNLTRTTILTTTPNFDKNIQFVNVNNVNNVNANNVNNVKLKVVNYCKTSIRVEHNRISASLVYLWRGDVNHSNMFGAGFKPNLSLSPMWLNEPRRPWGPIKVVPSLAG